MINNKCVVCGKAFEATQHAKYCSPSCKAWVANHAKATYQCVVCGTLFTGSRQSKPKFCSQKCTATAIKSVKEDPNSPLKSFVNISTSAPKIYKRVCSVCGTMFDTRSAKTENRQCPECAKTYGARWYKDVKKGAAIPLRITSNMLDSAIEYAGIQHPTEYGGCMSKSLAQNPNIPTQTREERNAKRRLNYAKRRALGMLPSKSRDQKQRDVIVAETPYCACCGYASYIEALQMHHIDMDRTNNDGKNLIVLCANCHSILHSRIKSKLQSFGQNKREGILQELEKLIAEVKARNEAGTADGLTRTEGSEQSESGATHSGTSNLDMSHHEAAPDVKSEKVC